MHYLITGAAGFIGSHLADRLLVEGHRVTGYDNLSTGQLEFLNDAMRSPNFSLIRDDILNEHSLLSAMLDVDVVLHMAANADVRFGLEHPSKDLEQNALGTFRVLEAMRNTGVKRIAFASTGSIYGEPEIFPTPENAPFPIQTSLYGASKLAAEALIQAYSEGFGFHGYIFRFVSILGERYSHGHVFDFYQQLLQHPDRLFVLGNGKQRKSYLFIQDCVDAMLVAIERSAARLNVYNLESDGFDLDWEIVIKLLRKKYFPLEVPVNYKSRTFQEGKKIHLLKDPLKGLRALFRYRFCRLDLNVSAAPTLQRQSGGPAIQTSSMK